MKILFRVSGGRENKRELGLGHIYRSINLAFCLKKHELHFLIEDYGGAKKLLESNGLHNLYLLKKNVSVDDDIEKTIRCVKKKKIDIVIIDKYGVDIKFLRQINKLTRLVLISDLRSIDYPVDLVVNGFIGFKNKVSTNRYGTKCLLGPFYQILNRKFANKPIPRKKKYTLLATFGGFDQNNIVELLLKSLEHRIDKIKTKIILGPATVQSNKIKMFKRKYKKQIKFISKTQDMRNEMSDVTVGICSGGLTTYEFAAMNIPFAIICQYRHQLITASEWKRLKIASNLGIINNVTQKNVEKFLNKILKNQINYPTNRRHIVDGLGSRRVASEILSLKPISI